MAITISDAQELLSLNLDQPRVKMPPDVRSAVQLALDALAYILMLRAGTAPIPTTPLPHEAALALHGNHDDKYQPTAEGPAPL